MLVSLPVPLQVALPVASGLRCRLHWGGSVGCVAVGVMPVAGSCVPAAVTTSRKEYAKKRPTVRAAGA